MPYKIVVVTDMEGLQGVNGWDDVTLGTPEYEICRGRLNKQIEDVCVMLKDKFGEDVEILIKDYHWTGRNLLPDNLIAQAKLISGSTDTPLQLEFLTSAKEDDIVGVILLNFHARAGSIENSLSHTLSFDKYNYIKINDIEVSELLLFRCESLFFKIPIVLVTGDENTCLEASAYDITHNFVITKKGAGNTVEHKSTCKVMSEIGRAIDKLTLEDFKAKDTEISAVILEISYKSPSQAYRASFYPKAILKNDNTVLLTCDTYYDVGRALMFI